jgi:hypothetical protein
MKRIRKLRAWSVLAGGTMLWAAETGVEVVVSGARGAWQREPWVA